MNFFRCNIIARNQAMHSITVVNYTYNFQLNMDLGKVCVIALCHRTGWVMKKNQLKLIYHRLTLIPTTLNLCQQMLKLKQP